MLKNFRTVTKLKENYWNNFFYLPFLINLQKKENMISFILWSNLYSLNTYKLKCTRPKAKIIVNFEKIFGLCIYSAQQIYEEQGFLDRPK